MEWFLRRFSYLFHIIVPPPLLIRLMLPVLLLRTPVLLSLRCEKKQKQKKEQKETKRKTTDLFYSFTNIISQKLALKLLFTAES